MSRARPYTYTTQPATPAGYYYDDADGYVGDYSENDSLSDTPPNAVSGTPDVMELYRRKTAAAAPAAEHYHQNVYVPAEYYYDGVSPQVSHKPTVQYRKRAPAANDRTRYYTSAEGELYDALAFRSAHQIAPTIAMNVPPRVPSASNVRQQSVRRHPITVRTPRYYRRPAGTGLYKRPSALCLPVACQPDPAVYKRSKRIDQTYTQELVYQNPTQTVTRDTTATHTTTKHAAQKMRGHEYLELNITKSKLDAALERYEQIFEKGSEPGMAKTPLPNPKLIQLIKPRVPSSIKERQQKTRIRRHRRHFEFPGADTLEVEEVASDVLEEILLADLTANGLSGKNQMSRPKRKNEERPKSPVSDSKSDSDRAPSPRNKAPNTAERPVKDLPKSFNYQEIQKGVVKTQKLHEPHQAVQQVMDDLGQSNPSRCTLNACDVSRPCDSPRQDSPPTSSRRQSSGFNLEKAMGTESIKLSGGATVPKVLVDDALELHRTKSYVVNLIDHALSNHFGTNLCEKYATKDFSMDHRVAMEILKKHSAGKMDKDLCVEIAQALADTFHSTTNCSTPAESTKQESTCSCSKISEEPLYVKQLKQLRWGHLKHIQREVRRLEDLERFLDSCSSNSFV